MEMTANDLLIKGRIHLQKDNPFFSYLSMRLKLIEDKNNEIGTCGVSDNFEMLYNPKWIEKLDLTNIKTLMAHEVMHIVFEHLSREKENKLEHDLYNISADVVINNILVNNNFNFSDELKGIVPYANKITLGKVIIEDIDKKTADEIYYILSSQKQEDKEQIQKEGEGFDKHLNSKSEIKGITEKELKQLISEANTYAQMQGKNPQSMGRYIDELLNPQLNWRELLHRYITKEIAVDYNYNMPSKRSLSVGIYMPKMLKEDVHISILVDVSGSITKAQITEFLSEVGGIANSFNSLKIHILFWDTELKSHFTLENRNVGQMLDYNFSGGGGTDFTGIYDYLNSEIPNTKLLIMLTDGFATFPTNEEVKTIVALSENSCPLEDVPFEVFKIWA